MMTEVINDIDLQMRWFEKINSSENDLFWVIENNHIPVGLISLTEIDRHNRHATWGLYMGERMESPIAGLIPFYFYNYIFSRKDLNLNKLYGMVLANNTSMLKNHRLCGYRDVGVYINHLLRGGVFIDVHLVELHKEIWLEKQKKYFRFIANFES